MCRRRDAYGDEQRQVVLERGMTTSCKRDDYPPEEKSPMVEIGTRQNPERMRGHLAPQGALCLSRAQG